MDPLYPNLSFGTYKSAVESFAILADEWIRTRKVWENDEWSMHVSNEFCYNDCKVPMGSFMYFCLKKFLVVDQWKVFTKTKLN